MNYPIDTIVLAGDGQGSRDIAGQSKLLLPIEGRALLSYVLEALAGVARIRRVVVIGPRAAIEGILSAMPAHSGAQPQITVLEQHATAYDNFWNAFLHTLDHYEEGLELRDQAVAQKPVLVVPADIPLISAAEVKEFLDAACELDPDYGIGMTDERYLERFYPVGELPGIRMNYLHVADGNLRLNNLHFIRPFQVKNRRHIQQIYEFRHQREFLNMLRVISDIVRTGDFGLRPLYLYALLQLSRLSNAWGCRRLLRITSRLVKREEVARYAGIMLQARVMIIETSGGGCAVDVDSEADYRTIERRFAEYAGRADPTGPQPASSAGRRPDGVSRPHHD
jgi:GTP:adenosylcobinamide-phosphate guanylyltransferase